MVNQINLATEEKQDQILSYFPIEMGSVIKSIQKGIASIISTSTDTNVSISPVNIDKSVILIDPATTSTSDLSTSFAITEFVSSSSFKVSRSDSGNTLAIGWTVIEFI